MANKVIEKISLRAGPLSLMYDKGDLRYIRLGEWEIIRRIYMAVRDQNWGNVPARLSHVQLEVGENGFQITYEAENRQDHVDFSWRGTIRGDVDGTLTFSLDGQARASFMKNRIGFCVLFPALAAGQPATIHHIDGTREEAVFPVDISGDQPVIPFYDLKAITQTKDKEHGFEVLYEGDIFEMEDQRLWTDASYKVFSTPLALPYPVEIPGGTRVRQLIQVTVQQAPGRKVNRKRTGAGIKAGEVRITFPGEESWQCLPDLGAGMASHERPLSLTELERLRVLHLHHLRVDLPLASPTYPERLQRAATESEALGVGLEAALFIRADQAEAELQGLLSLLRTMKLRILSWLVYPAVELWGGGSPTDLVLSAARKVLGGYGDSIPFCAGSNNDFVFMKRTPPSISLMDRACVAMNPQTHAFDDASMVETLEAQPMVVESARRLAGGLPVVVSPITLKPRFNAYATGPAMPTPPGVLPPQVDPRQLSLFGAGWTLSSLRAMIIAKAASVTYFETTGWRGVMESENGPEIPDLFPSRPGQVFPLYHILADAGEFTDGWGLPLESGDALKTSGLAFKNHQRQRILLANHTPEYLPILLHIPSGHYQISYLDKTTESTATNTPAEYRQAWGDPVESKAGRLRITLRPYGLARLDHR